MAQQYLGVIAKAASSFAGGDNQSKGRNGNDLVTRMEGEAVRAIGSKLMGGNTMMGSNSHPQRVGQLFNRVSSWHQDNNRGSYSGGDGGYGNRVMPNDGYDNQRGGYGYGGGSGWNAAPSGTGGYGYESRGGYGGDAGWNSGGGGLGRQGYYENNSYDGCGNRGRMNDGCYR